MELLAVVTILGIIAAIVIPRVVTSTDAAKQKVDDTNRARINSQVEQYYVNEGSWPLDNLSDIEANTNYFPEGLPANPTGGAAYSLNTTTHRVL